MKVTLHKEIMYDVNGIANYYTVKDGTAKVAELRYERVPECMIAHVTMCRTKKSDFKAVRKISNSLAQQLCKRHNYDEIYIHTYLTKLVKFLTYGKAFRIENDPLGMPLYSYIPEG